MDLEEGEIIDENMSLGSHSMKYPPQGRPYNHPRMPMHSGPILPGFSNRFPPPGPPFPPPPWPPAANFHRNVEFSNSAIHYNYFPPHPSEVFNSNEPSTVGRIRRSSGSSSSSFSSTDSSERQYRRHRSNKKKHRHSKRPKHKHSQESESKKRRHTSSVDSISHNFIKALNKKSLQTAISSHAQNTSSGDDGATSVHSQPPTNEYGITESKTNLLTTLPSPWPSLPAMPSIHRPALTPSSSFPPPAPGAPSTLLMRNIPPPSLSSSVSMGLPPPQLNAPPLPPFPLAPSSNDWSVDVSINSQISRTATSALDCITVRHSTMKTTLLGEAPAIVRPSALPPDLPAPQALFNGASVSSKRGLLPPPVSAMGGVIPYPSLDNPVVPSFPAVRPEGFKCIGYGNGPVVITTTTTAAATSCPVTSKPLVSTASTFPLSTFSTNIPENVKRISSDIKSVHDELDNQSDMSISESEDKGAPIKIEETYSAASPPSTHSSQSPEKNSTLDMHDLLPPPESGVFKKVELHHLCMGNLKPTTTCEDILLLLEKYGTVTSIRIACVYKRFYIAIVSMEDSQARDNAVDELHSSWVNVAQDALHVQKASYNVLAS